MLRTLCNCLLSHHRVGRRRLPDPGGGGAAGGGGTTGGGASRSRLSGAPAAAPAPSAASDARRYRIAFVECAGHIAGEPAPGVANTPVDPQRSNVDANPSSQRLPGTTANSPNGTTQPGATPPTTPQATSSGRPDPGGANSSPNSTRTGKNAAQQGIADCVRLWDKGTHMTRGEWLTTCRRVQGRLDNLKIDPIEPKTASKRQRSAKTQSE